jgi:hypothetical protein
MMRLEGGRTLRLERLERLVELEGAAMEKIEGRKEDVCMWARE